MQAQKHVLKLHTQRAVFCGAGLLFCLPDGAKSVELRQVRAIAPEDEDGSLDLWRETWTSPSGPNLGGEGLQTMLRGLDRGTAAMLPGQGESGHALVQGRLIVGSAIVRERGEVA